MSNTKKDLQEFSDANPHSLKEELVKDLKLFTGIFLGGLLAFLLFTGYAFLAEKKPLNAKNQSAITVITAPSNHAFVNQSEPTRGTFHFGKVLSAGLALICFSFVLISVLEWRESQQWTINYNRTFGQATK